MTWGKAQKEEEGANPSYQQADIPEQKPERRQKECGAGQG